MSYELRIFALRTGESPVNTARNRSDELPSTPPDPVVEAHKHRLAVALIRLNPRLKQCAFDHEELARFDRITPDEARMRYRHIELNGSSGGHGVQVALFDDEVIVSVPCWHRGSQAAVVFQEVWSYLQVIIRETKYCLYDPQMEALVPFPEGGAKVLQHYRLVVERLDCKPAPAMALLDLELANAAVP